MQTKPLPSKINCKHWQAPGFGRAFCLVKPTLSSWKNKQRNYSHLFVCFLIGSFVTFRKFKSTSDLLSQATEILIWLQKCQSWQVSCLVASGGFLREEKLWKRPLEFNKFNNLLLCYAWLKILFFCRYLEPMYQPHWYNTAGLNWSDKSLGCNSCSLQNVFSF